MERIKEGRASARIFAAGAPSMRWVKARYSPSGVVSRRSDATSVCIFFAKAWAAGVGSPSR
ncbi:MAG: hypothetical protein U5J83_09845 [Bryobacterales bacterium]|nr:hypothetical protein [Bryobacterales bacterium]